MPTRILITEDELLVALDLEQRLCKLGYEVCATVSTGEEALHLVSLKPDLVLMDIQLEGELDGIQTAAILRDRHGLPVIYLSANADEKTLRRAQLTHAASYLLKPFKERELQICIELALSNHALQVQLRESRDQLEKRVMERTAELAATNKTLMEEIRIRQIAEHDTRQKAALLDKARDAIFVRNLGGRITYWNHSAARFYGYSAEQALGEAADKLTGTLDDYAHNDALAATMSEGSWTGELVDRTRDGVELVVESRWTLVRCEHSGEPQAILVVNTDMTERKKIEAQFLRAQRLESIGSLASGIAHDLNNVFTPLIMSGQLLGDATLADTDRRTVDIMLKSAKRGADMVRQILMFVRGSEGEREAFPLEHLVEEVRRLVEETFPRSIRIRSRFSSHLPLVLGDATRLHQVIMNLCVNARDAMESGGELQLRVENCVVTPAIAAQHTGVQPGTFLRLTVSDTGRGMTPEIVENIFDPFFTTKGPGKGTGLGLPTVQAIIRDHDGFLEVETAPGAGAHFHVYLPIAPSDPCIEEEAFFAAPQANGECILLVDDEHSVREIMKVALEAYGYKTLSACDGTDALTQFATHRERIACIVMDLMMPHLDGMATSRALRRMHQSVPIILVSGLDSSELPTAALSEHQILALAKPFTREQLLMSVHKSLSCSLARGCSAIGS